MFAQYKEKHGINQFEAIHHQLAPNNYQKGVQLGRRNLPESAQDGQSKKIQNVE